MSFRLDNTIESADESKFIGSEHYTERATDINILSMMEQVSQLIGEQIDSIYQRALSSELWSNEYINLQDIENFTSYFEPLTGGIKTDIEFHNPLLNAFYEGYGRTYIRGGLRETRAKSYYIAVDPDYISNFEKLSVIQRDLNDAYQIIQLLDRKSLKGADYFGYLGVLDYIKQHTLTLFHVLTYPERFGNFFTDEEYLRFRNIAINLVEVNIKAFYQACLGQSFDSRFGSSEDLEKINQLISYIGTLERDYRQYTLQEVDHPLRMMAHVNEVLNLYPETETLIPILSGGTQSSLLVGEGYKLMGKGVLPVVYLPLSTHSAKMNFGSTFNSNTLIEYLSNYRELIQGKNILVNEDNSNSGQTAQMIYDALMALGAKSVHIAFVEIDPHRVMYKQSSSREVKGEFVSNYLHPDFNSSIGVLPVARYLKQDYQLRKMYVWRLFNSYK